MDFDDAAEFWFFATGSTLVGWLRRLMCVFCICIPIGEPLSAASTTTNISHPNICEATLINHSTSTNTLTFVTHFKPFNTHLGRQSESFIACSLSDSEWRRNTAPHKWCLPTKRISTLHNHTSIYIHTHQHTSEDFFAHSFQGRTSIFFERAKKHFFRPTSRRK